VTGQRENKFPHAQLLTGQPQKKLLARIDEKRPDRKSGAQTLLSGSKQTKTKKSNLTRPAEEVTGLCMHTQKKKDSACTHLLTGPGKKNRKRRPC
jgi:hypothetical protein